MTRRAPLDADHIVQRLDQWFEVEFSYRDTEAPARQLAALERDDQEYVLGWAQRIASTNIEVAYRFSRLAARSLAAMERRMIEAWVLHAMDVYDRSGLHPALAVIEDVDRFVHLSRVRASGAMLADASNVLTTFVHGLSGRRLKIEEGERPWTDTETLYLPPVLARLESSEENFALYKATAAMLWAQVRFGTFRRPLGEALAGFGDPAKALGHFQALETLRLESVLAQELPGLYRAMQGLKAALGEADVPPGWEAHAAQLRRREATVDDSLQLLAAVYPGAVPEAVCYQAGLDPAAVAACMAARVAREEARFRTALARMREELKEARRDGREPAERFGTRRIEDPAQPEGFRLELLLDEQPVAPPDDVRGLMSSIVVDFGEIPDEYLTPAGPGEYDPSLLEEKRLDPDEVWQGTYHEEGAELYPEWDFRREHYRKNWCVMREKEVAPVEDGFAARTLHKYGGLVKHLRKTFEAMRDEERTLKGQVDGDGIDLEALVEALADARDGREMSERLFTRQHRRERNIAVVFMVDMSGSTRGWINDAERESLVLLAEALETLGDRYAIYGFSGITRKRCELYRVKTFDEPYGPGVQARISGIRPQDYTRMGFAIRHLTRVLNDTGARTRLLVTLSDGKPDDYDNYRGEYGIEDTRRALVEARRAGVHPYCITIDEQARDYLPHLYGPAAYTVVDEVARLPYKVSDIYRRLTT